MRITGNTRLTGLFGYPVEHSVSPQMHNAAFGALALDWCYVPFSVRLAELGDAVRGVRALGFVGVNVTIPHKEAVVGLVDEVDPTAALIGAVNTIRRVENRLLGYNTDAEGFMRSLRAAGFSPDGRRAAVLGAGGAAKAVTVALAQAGADRLDIVALEEEKDKAAALAALAGRASGGKTSGHANIWSHAALREVAGHADILVNATPIGMHPKSDVDPPVQEDWLREGMWVYDLVYHPRNTRLLEAAERRGCPAVSGVGMLVHQGGLSFQMWTGLEAPLDTMERAVLEALGAERAA